MSSLWFASSCQSITSFGIIKPSTNELTTPSPHTQNHQIYSMRLLGLYIHTGTATSDIEEDEGEQYRPSQPPYTATVKTSPQGDTCCSLVVTSRRSTAMDDLHQQYLLQKGNMAKIYQEWTTIYRQFYERKYIEYITGRETFASHFVGET